MPTLSEHIYVILFNVHDVPNQASKWQTKQIVVIWVTGRVASPMSRYSGVQFCYFHRSTESNPSLLIPRSIIQTFYFGQSAWQHIMKEHVTED